MSKENLRNDRTQNRESLHPGTSRIINEFPYMGKRPKDKHLRAIKGTISPYGGMR